MLTICPFDIYVGIRAFVIGLSQISSFFSQKRKICNMEIEIITLVVKGSVKLTVPTN